MRWHVWLSRSRYLLTFWRFHLCIILRSSHRIRIDCNFDILGHTLHNPLLLFSFLFSLTPQVSLCFLDVWHLRVTDLELIVDGSTPGWIVPPLISVKDIIDLSASFFRSENIWKCLLGG